MNSLISQEARLCLACGKPIRGRIDKKCCNDYCRNIYNNQRRPRAEAISVVKSVNNILFRNRNILESLVSQRTRTTRTSLQKLQLQNFQFGYFTHQQKIAGGKTCYCCYEYGYLPLNDERCLVMKVLEEEI
jgi:predicted nucleic acid-binding Zn ribbon protein